MIEHNPDCDVNDINPDGIKKPCNCGAQNSSAAAPSLESRADAAWSAYIDACEKARQDREAIDAIVYSARHAWTELNCELIRAQSAKK
jgi:hypothetical protein